jgi:hypothetical protein
MAPKKEKPMDASILQAAQRVVNWHLQHTVLPAPPLEPADRAGDEEAATGGDGQAESEGGGPAPSRA